MENNRLYINRSIVNNLPSAVASQLSSMSADKQQLFVEEYERKKKSVGMAYFFHLICFGAPYGYLGKWGWQIIYWITGFGAFLWFLILLFVLPSMVHDYNKDVALEVLKDLKIMGGDSSDSNNKTETLKNGNSEETVANTSNLALGNDVCSYSTEKLNEILSNESIYNPKLVESCRKELEIRIDSDKFAEYAESRTDAELREVLGNPEQFNPAMVRCCNKVVNARREKAEEAERKRAEEERLRQEELRRKRLAEEEAERLAARKRRLEFWKKWRVVICCGLMAVALGAVGVVAFQNIQERIRHERLVQEKLNARKEAEKKAEAERLERERIEEEKRKAEAQRKAEAERIRRERVAEEKRKAEEKAELERIEAKRKEQEIAAEAERAAAKKELERSIEASYLLKQTIKVGQTLQLRCKDKVKMWVSLNKSIAQVSEQGLVKGIAKGQVYIWAYTDDATVIYTITVQ